MSSQMSLYTAGCLLALTRCLFKVICSSAPTLGSFRDASCLCLIWRLCCWKFLGLNVLEIRSGNHVGLLSFPWLCCLCKNLLVSELVLNLFPSAYQASFALKTLMNVSFSPTLVRMEVPAPTTTAAMPVSVSMVGVGTTAVRTLMIASLPPVLMDLLASIEWLLFHAFVQKERQVRTENLHRSGT